MNTSLFNDTIEDIRAAADIIRSGGLVAFPTETVYGLGANAFDAEAVKKVYEAKGRPSDNPMIVHIAEATELAKLTPEITEDMKLLAEAFWPGPLTMVVKRAEDIPDVTTGGLDTVGVRLPSDETARALIRLSGCAIAAPSANLSGRPSPTKAAHVKHDLFGRIDGIIMGKDCSFGIESSVIDMTGDIPMILRPGIITKEMFEEALCKEVLTDPSLNRNPGDEDFKPKAPGMKYKHYAPKAEMYVYRGRPEKVKAAIEAEAARLEAAGRTVRVISFTAGKEGELKAAHDLFSELRRADEDGAEVILAAALPEQGVGFSVMNRMLKSAGYNIRNV